MPDNLNPFTQPASPHAFYFKIQRSEMGLTGCNKGIKRRNQMDFELTFMKMAAEASGIFWWIAIAKLTHFNLNRLHKIPWWLLLISYFAVTLAYYILRTLVFRG